MEVYVYKIAIGAGEDGRPVLAEKRVPKNEDSYASAIAEAYGGEITIEEDDAAPIASPLERISDLEAALDLLLSGATE